MEITEDSKRKINYQIRLATLSDIDQIIRINRSALPENYPYYFFVEHLKEYGQAFYVADLEGEVVGYVMPRIEWGFSNLKHIPSLVRKGHIVSIAVLEPFRKIGVGTSLLQNSLRAMKDTYNAEEVYLEVRVTNYPAISLYKKFNFKEVKLLKHYYADGEDAYLMAAPL
ncbi:N-acetyltransferase [Sulfolobus acidocaldarius SUSAZ]|nr:N-acetyltransferase [Sulfolobus acidocaldarius SUSAZ]